MRRWQRGGVGSPAAFAIIGFSIGAFVAIDYPEFRSLRGVVARATGEVRADGDRAAERLAMRFEPCRPGNLHSCVVDGDTVRIEGRTIRLADIDAPEVDPPRCEAEAVLGFRATERLAELLNAGPFDLQPVEGRDGDRHGRPLRLAMRGGVSVTEPMIAEGLARRYRWNRAPWC